MFGKVASKILNKYLKEYITDLDSKHLDMKLWKGNATFQDLDLKETAFSRHDLPLNVAKGILGNIEVNFPWKKLSTEPTKISISNVFILLNPDPKIVIKTDSQADYSAFHIGTVEQVKNEKAEKKTLLSIFNAVIDNLEININNIHVRLEYEIEEGNFVSCGILIPSITLYSINEEGERISKHARREKKIYKKLDVNSISAYFDTTQVVIDKENFKQQMFDEISKQHQFVLNPFSLNGTLSHNRLEDAVFKNIIEFSTQNLHFSVDLMQCKTLMKINRNWLKFQQSRKYAHIGKPEDINDYQKMFCYTAKCAICKAWPNQFNPKLALSFLKNRKQYLELIEKKRMKKAAKAIKKMFSKKTQKEEKKIDGLKSAFSKKELQRFIKRVGPETAFYLKLYGDIIMNKQASFEESKNSEIDLSSLKGMGDVEEFNIDSVELHCNVFQIQFEVNYFANMPLFRIIFEKINSHTCKTENILQNFSIKKETVYYFDPQKEDCKFTNEEGKLIYSSSDLNIAYNLMQFESPSFYFTSSPLFISFDASTIKYIYEFISNRMDINSVGSNSTIYIADQLQMLKAFRVIKCSIYIPKVSLALPYIDKEKEKAIKFEIESINFGKDGQKNTEKLLFSSEASCILKNIWIDNDLIVSNSYISLANALAFYENSFNVDLNLNFSIVGARFSLSEKSCESIKNAISYINEFAAEGEEGNAKNVKSETTVSFKKLSGSITADVDDTALALLDKENLRSEAKVNGFSLKYEINEGIQSTKLANFNLQQYGNNNIDIVDPKIIFKDNMIEVETNNLFFVFDRDYYEWIMQIFSPLTSGEENNAVEEDNSENLSLRFNLNNSYIEIANKEKENIIMNANSLFFDINQEGTKIKLDKISAKHYERVVFDEFSFNLNLEPAQDDFVLELPRLIIGIDPSALKEVISTIYWIIRLIPPSDAAEPSSTTKLSLVLEKGLELNGFKKDKKIFGMDISHVTLNYKEEAGKMLVDLKLPKIDGNYAEELKFIDMEDICLSYNAEGINSNVNVSFDNHEFNLSKESYKWIMGLADAFTYDDQSNQNEAQAGEMILSLKQKECSPMKLSLVKDQKESISIFVGAFKMDGLISDATNIKLEVENLSMKSFAFPELNIIDTPFIAMNMSDNFIKVKLNQELSVLSSVSTLQEMGETFGEVFSGENSEVVEEQSNEIGIGFGIELPSFKFHLLSPNNERFIDCFVNNINCSLNVDTKKGSLSVDSIEMFSIYKQFDEVKREQIIDIKPITALISCTDDESNSSKKTICFANLSTSLTVESINVFYSHRIAKNILKCIPISDNVTPENNASPSTGSKVNMKANISINEFNITLSKAEPFAMIKFNSIGAQLSDKLSASIGDFYVLNKDGKSFISYPSNGKKFLSVDTKEEKLCVDLIETSLLLDYSYWISLVSFITMSPLLSLGGNETEAQEDLAFPLCLSFNAPSFMIKLPVDDNSYFNIMLNAAVEMGTRVLSLNVNNFSVNYENIHQYPPLLDDISFSFEISQTEDGEIFKKMIVSDIEAKVSVSDIIGFNSIASRFEKSLNEITFGAFSNSSNAESPTNQTPSNIELISGDTKIIFCRDNRTSTKYIPLFRFVIPPITIKLSSVSSINCVALDLGLYINFFNDKTGNYDDIVEPFNVRIISTIANTSLLFDMKIDKIININLPMNAIDNYMAIVKEIKASINKSQMCNDFPGLWISNQIKSVVKFSIKTEQEENIVMELDHEQIVPIYNVDANCDIEITIDGESFEFKTSTLVFPIMALNSVTISKRPYNGGIIVEVAAPCEIENDLTTSLYVFHQINNKGPYVKRGILKPRSRYPLQLKQSEGIIFTRTSTLTKANKPMKITSDINKPLLCPIVCDDSTLYSVRTVEIERNTGRKVLRLKSAVSLISNIHMPLKIMLPNDKILTVKESDEAQLDFINPSNRKITIIISLDGINYCEWIIGLNKKDTQMFRIMHPETNEYTNLAVKIDKSNVPFIRIVVFSTAIIFNQTRRTIVFRPVADKIETDEFEVKPENNAFFTPLIFKDDDECNVEFKFSEGKYSEKISLLSTASGTLYSATENENVFMPIRYDIKKSGFSSIVTLTDVLLVENKLPFAINIQPISLKEKDRCQEEEDSQNETNDKESEKAVKISTIDANSRGSIDIMTKNGSFVFWAKGYTTNTLICLTVKQRIVFIVQNEVERYLIELNVVDNGCSFVAEFKTAKFPTPYVITNELDTRVESYQTNPNHRFIGDPHTTTIFAFDDPFSYPCIHFVIEGCDEVANISLADDTDFIKLPQTVGEKPIYVAVKLTSDGFRTVLLVHKLPENIVQTDIKVPIHISGISISLINHDMEEVCLLTIQNIVANFSKNSQGSCIKFKISDISLDDQHPKSAVESVMIGNTFSRVPFFTLDAIMPPDVPLFTSFDIIRVSSKMLVFQIDHAFAADLLHTFDTILGDLHTVIKPNEPEEIQPGTNQRKISIGYLEVMPMTMYASLKTSSKRPIETEALPYMQIIPSLKGVFSMSGIVISQVTDTVQNIVKYIKDDYSSALFNQAINMLGFSGKIMSTVGVASAIAEVLGVKLNNDMETDIKQFFQNENACEFDNRSHSNGFLSKEKLQFLQERISLFKTRPSPIITSLLETETYDGLAFKSLRGSRTCFGLNEGILGVINEELTDERKKDAKSFTSHKLTRKRIPHDYPWNVIRPYNERSAEVQEQLQKASKERSRIRLNIDISETKKCIVSDECIFFIDSEDNSINSIAIKDAKIELDDKTVHVKASREKMDILCNSKEDAFTLFVFINSQKRYIKLFSSSLI